ncbi:MAG TPA: O-antigen ligase family protein [Fimbriimonadaceae bacterium]|nr:O-antigen ligase family protein [Fimbriimonadaceae bacterium]
MTQGLARWAVGGLALALFLAPLWGGYLSLEPMALEPGLAGLITALAKEPSAATFAHGLIATLVGLALVPALVRWKVIQLPPLRLAAPVLFFWLLLMLSLLMSSYRTISLTAFAEWTTYVAIFFGIVATVGRRAGPRILLAAFFAGCVLVALNGIREYVPQTDLTWRIFSTWMHPNALAGLLGMGLFVGLGLLSTTKGSAALLTGLGSILIALALLMTQSKGGVLAVLIGAPVFMVMSAAWSEGKAAAAKRVGAAVAVLVLAPALYAGLQSLMRNRPAPQQPGATVASQSTAPTFGRLAQASTSQEQSAGFRTLLWKSTAQLVRMNPGGWGIGTYRFHSSRPGMVTQTHFAHNQYLQLAAEANPLAPLLFLAAGLIWLAEMFRGARKLPSEQNLLRAGVVAAVLFSAMHNAIDSDISHFGIGLSFFALLGIGVLLAGDAALPEFVPKIGRWFAAFVALLFPLLLLVFGYGELQLGYAESALASRNAELAQSLAESAKSFLPMDGRPYASLARASAPGPQRLEVLAKAAVLEPSPRAFRMYARELEVKGDIGAARGALGQALRMDPNNLTALNLLLEMDLRQESPSAKETAERLIAVEGTPYFKVRSIPELVPTETYGARLVLAEMVPAKDRPALLRPAVEGYRNYLTRTVSQILHNLKTAGAPVFVSENLLQAQQKLRKGVGAAQMLLDSYRAEGDRAGEAWAREALGELTGGLEAVGEALAPPKP